jgi:hypothetical protein
MRRSVICCVVVLVPTLVLAGCGASGQGPQTWLDRPLDGSRLPLGPVTILAHASDADGVSSFEFSIDGDPLATVPASGGRLGEATAGWTPTEPGTYTIGAIATDSAGNVGSEATSVVTVGDLPEASPTSPPEPEGGEILFFVEPELVPAGGCAVLRWEVHLPTEALLDGESVPAAGEREVCPEATRIYELLVPEHDQVRFATLHVELPFEGIEILLAVDPDVIPQGECALLVWEVHGPEEWPSLLDGSEVPHFGEREVCPPSTNSYELLVETPDGAQVRTVTLRVEAAEEPTSPAEPTPRPPAEPTTAPPTGPTPTSPSGCPGAPVISYFTANPSTINAGQSSTLDWGAVTNGNSSELVRSVVIEPGLGEVGSPGQRVVSPGSTTTYTMIANGCGGETRQQVTIVVNPAPAPPSGIDLAITDLYADGLYGSVWARITNHGPGTVSNQTIHITCQWDESMSGRPLGPGQMGPIPLPIGSLSSGQTQAFNADISVTLGDDHEYDMTCTIQVPFNDPNPGNNSHSETLTKQSPGGT